VSAAKRAGLPRIKLRELRHSFGTRAIRAFNLYDVQRMMGHRHITTTEKYVHYAPDPDAAAKLSGLWGAADGEDGSNVVPPRAPMGSLWRAWPAHSAGGR
jgi:integrase